MTSGQMVTTTTQHVECDGIVTQLFPIWDNPNTPKFEQSWPCTFAGEVDITIDPETVTAGWECPTCSTWHDTDPDNLTPDRDTERL